MTRAIRIGNAQAFWGDRNDAAAELLAREPELDYLTLDYLAEVSLSILARQQLRDPQAGFAQDFQAVVRSLIPYWSAGGRCRLVTNAGGLNPQGCAEACRQLLRESNCRGLRIGVVDGDDVLEHLRNPSRAGDFHHLDTGEEVSKVRERLVTANAYLGAEPIVAALEQDADIVITGRVADPSLTVAACRHHFGWSEDDWQRLAGATVAGHLIECGTQVTGGISTDWLEVPGAADIGFPIVEVAADASCVVTKPTGSGGCVTAATVKEQLVYEIGDPGRYLSPDVTVSFLSLQVDDLGSDRVRVSGATGAPHPETYKVSATYEDGYRAAGTLVIIGRDAILKARRAAEAVLHRVDQSGHELCNRIIECLGSGDAAAGIAGRPATFETVLRIAVEAESREAVECFSRELVPLITAGPQGTTGYAEGRPRVHPLVRYWPCLIERGAVHPQVTMLQIPQPVRQMTPSSIPSSPRPQRDKVDLSNSTMCIRNQPTLFDIATARSGDKGIHANVGVIARDEAAWDFIRDWLTASRVADYFSPWGIDGVERYELSNLQAVNFVLRGALRRSLRTDAQGKALGQIMLAMPIPGK